MGVPERDPNLHVVEQVDGGARSIDRPQRYTRSAQLGNPPGYSDASGAGSVPGSGAAPGAGPSTQQFPQPGPPPMPPPMPPPAPPPAPTWIPEQSVQQPVQQQHGQQRFAPQRFEQPGPAQGHWCEPPRPRRRPGHSDWEVCLRFPFGRLRFGGFIGWESD